MTDRLVFVCGGLAKREGRSLINPRDFQAAIKFTFSPAAEISLIACNRAAQSVLRFMTL